MIPDLYDRKLGLLEILAASWRVYAQNFKFLLLFVFLLNFLAYRINYSLVIWSGVKISLPFWMPASWNIRTLFVPFVTALSTVLVIQIIADSIRGESVKIIRITRRSVRYFLPAVAICFIFMVWQLITFLPALIAYRVDLSGISTVLLVSIMTLIYLTVAVYTAFVYPSMVLENKSSLAAFRHSFEMVRGRWWYFFLAWVVLTLPAGAVCFLIRRTVATVGFGEIGQHAMWALSALIRSFSICGITILFLNIDRKNEAPDSAMPIIQSENT